MIESAVCPTASMYSASTPCPAKCSRAVASSALWSCGESAGSPPIDRPPAGVVTGATLVTISFAPNALTNCTPRSRARFDGSVSS